MVAGYEGYVLHAGIFGRAYPGLCIKTDGIEYVNEATVFRYLDIALVHHPFAMAQHTGGAPMYKHAKAGTVEPFTGFKVLGGRCIAGLAEAGDSNDGKGECKR